MSNPYPPFGSQNVRDDDGQVIDSFLIETDSPPNILEALKELMTPIREALKTPTPTGRLLTGTMTLAPGANYFNAPTMILPADANRTSLSLSVSSNASTTGALTQLLSTGTAVAGPTVLKSVVISSSDGATSGNGKVEVRDGAGGPVRLTLVTGPGLSGVWQSDSSGIPFTTGVHLTISGTGPGNFVMVETESAETSAYLSIADDNGKCLTSGAFTMRPGANTPLTLGGYTGPLFVMLPPTATASMEISWVAVTA